MINIRLLCLQLVEDNHRLYGDNSIFWWARSKPWACGTCSSHSGAKGAACWQITSLPTRSCFVAPALLMFSRPCVGESRVERPLIVMSLL